MSPENLPKKFLKWKNKFVKWHNWSKKRSISKVDAIFSFLNSNKNIDKIIFGVQNLNQLNEILNLKIKKLEFQLILNQRIKIL